MAEVFANCEDPDQTLHSVASDLGLHCLPITLLGVSLLQWVKQQYLSYFLTNFEQSCPKILVFLS